jgi:hypothetical protein
MRARSLLLPASLFVIAILGARSASASALWGNSGVRVSPINVATGAPGPIVSFAGASTIGFSDLAGDVRWQGPLLWGVSDFGANRHLQALNPATMAAQASVPISGPEPIQSLAIDPLTGEFYGGSATSLYRIGLDTGIASLVGVTPLPIEKALGFDGAGNLYGIANENQLVAVNKSTGETSLISTLNVFRMEDIAVQPESGIMYGIGYGPNYSLYQIDLTTGALVNLGPSTTRPSGLAFTAVPEPATLTLSALALAGRLRRRR